MLEESLDPHEDVDEHILARIYIFGCLTNTSVIIVHTERSRMMLTKRSTPIPEKITLAGENAWGITIRSLILGI